MEKTENSSLPPGEEQPNEEDDARARSLQLGGAPGIKVGGFGKAFTFLGEVREEMKKVTWPTRKMVVVETVVVLCVMTFFTLMITGLDMVFAAGFNAILFGNQ